MSRNVAQNIVFQSRNLLLFSRHQDFVIIVVIIIIVFIIAHLIFVKKNRFDNLWNNNCALIAVIIVINNVFQRINRDDDRGRGIFVFIFILSIGVFVFRLRNRILNLGNHRKIIPLIGTSFVVPFRDVRINRGAQLKLVVAVSLTVSSRRRKLLIIRPVLDTDDLAVFIFDKLFFA